MFSFRLLDAMSGTDMHCPESMQGFKLNEDSLDAYLDPEVADEGVVGGEICFGNKNDRSTLEVVYWHPGTPSHQLVKSLQAYTVAQLEDGMGEGGFEFEFGDKLLVALANTEEPVIVEMHEDERVVLRPSQIAITARDGDLSCLVAAIKDDPHSINRLHQGGTALHLAILYGHSEAVQPLLAAGANPNIIDFNGITPLEACALTNEIDDEQSRDIARMLLDAGADPEHETPDGWSAKYYAELRGKMLLASIL